MKRILVAIDFSDVTDDVLSKAITLTKALQGKMLILHVDDSAPYHYTPKDQADVEPEPDEETAKVEPSNLETVRGRMSNEQMDVEYRLAEGPAADNIILAAREFAADMIVIGAHEHGKFYHCLFDDTTESLIRHTTCPILVVPHKETA